MGSGREKRSLQEMFSTSSSVHMGKHKTFIKSLLDRGYEIESQEKSEEIGSGGELVSESLTTILVTKNSALPQLKFVATETFGKFNYEAQAFMEYDEPAYDLKTYQRSSDIRRHNDPWGPIELGD